MSMHVRVCDVCVCVLCVLVCVHGVCSCCVCVVVCAFSCIV